MIRRASISIPALPFRFMFEAPLGMFKPRVIPAEKVHFFDYSLLTNDLLFCSIHIVLFLCFSESVGEV